MTTDTGTRVTISESASIGPGTAVGDFTLVHAGARVGSNCNIASHVVLGELVVIGERVRIGGGVQLPNGTLIEDDVVIEVGVVFAEQHAAASPTTIRRGARIGANATLAGGVTIGRFAQVEAGSVILQDVPPNAVVRGNPALISGYVETGAITVRKGPAGADSPIHVRGVNWVKLPAHADMRGNLTVAEFGKDLPFQPKRIFLVYDVPSEKVRGEHAHRECHQILLCVSGSARVLADDGKNRQEFLLDSPSLGLHLSPMTWGSQYHYSPGSVLLVFASQEYSSSDYLRTYDEFLRELERKQPV